MHVCGSNGFWYDSNSHLTGNVSRTYKSGTINTFQAMVNFYKDILKRI